MFLIPLHNLVANAVTTYLLLVGLWGLVGYFRGFGLTKNYAGALAIGEIVLLAQGVIGVLLVLTGLQPRDGMHYLYGVGSALGLPLAYTYLRGREDRKALLVYSVVTLFVFGLALRAITTAV